MSLTILPKYVQIYTINKFLSPEKITRQEVLNSGKNLINLSLVNKEFTSKLKDIFSAKLSCLKRSYELLKKYDGYCYQFNFEYELRFPLLFDALTTGGLIPRGSCSEEFTPEIENDIKEFVKLHPESVNLPQNESFHYMTPLVAACTNRKAPIHIIEFLLQNGATSEKVTRSGFENRRINELQKDTERFNKISELFEKYGLKI